MITPSTQIVCHTLVGLVLIGASQPLQAGIIVNDGGSLTVNSTVTLPAAGAVEILSGGQSNVPTGGTVDGDVTVNASGTLNLCGTITGSLDNSGTVLLECGDSGIVGGDLLNAGAVRLTYGTSLSITGNTTNSALLDIVTAGSFTTSGTFTNTGTIWNLDEASRETQIEVNGDDATVSIGAVSPHFYQLQQRDDLLTGDWADAGSRQAGPGTLQFTDVDTLLTNDKNFYRLKITDD